jgi:hypothetical protein
MAAQTAALFIHVEAGEDEEEEEEKKKVDMWWESDEEEYVEEEEKEVAFESEPEERSKLAAEKGRQFRGNLADVLFGSSR